MWKLLYGLGLLFYLIVRQVTGDNGIGKDRLCFFQNIFFAVSSGNVG
jgi:hypothetical protein